MGRFFVYAMMFVLVLICQVFASTPDSLRIWEKKIERRTPEDGDAWVQLGQAYLKAGKLRRAEKAFRKGIRYGELAEAYNGVGLVFSNWEHQERLAFYYFRRALGADPTFIEAQMNTARLRLKLEDSDAETALMEAIQMDSTYAPAYLMLAEWYFDSGYTDRMVALYGKYLDMRPDDLDAHFGLARTYLEQHQFRPTLKVAELVLQRNPDAIQFLPLAAQVYAVQGNADRALALFLAYIEALPEDERRLYEDPSLVAFLKDLEAFHNTPESEREAFLEAFWRKLDLTQVSGGKARRVEHYRRVWYARTYFSEKVKPWDRRGEVYIRFGEPDYRSRSNAVNQVPSLAVQAVKERIGAVLHGSDLGENRNRRKAELMMGPLVGEQEAYFSVEQAERRLSGIGPVFPVRRSSLDRTNTVPWESWVYTKISGGIELVFTDEGLTGQWDFAPLPPEQWQELAFNRNPAKNPGMRFHQLLPAAVMRDVVAVTPEYYTRPPGVQHLDFYYDMATFQASEGQSEVEVYFGIVPELMAVREKDDRVWMDLERKAVLSNQDGDVVYSVSEDMPIGGAKVSFEALAKKGTIVPDMVSLEVPPGEYRLAVQLVDRASGKWGLYLQEVHVPGYGDSLAVSDLEVAGAISNMKGALKFQKGDVRVLPMPTRTYRLGQSAYIYYEIYHLQPDAFGQTRYRVTYTVRRDVRRRLGVFGAVAAGFKQLVSREKPEVSVSYDRAGEEIREPVYFELDTWDLEPGVHEISVAVEDLNGGGTVHKEAMFTVVR